LARLEKFEELNYFIYGLDPETASLAGLATGRECSRGGSINGPRKPITGFNRPGAHKRRGETFSG
jgi:hypothetical protein